MSETLSTCEMELVIITASHVSTGIWLIKAALHIHIMKSLLDYFYRGIIKSNLTCFLTAGVFAGPPHLLPQDLHDARYAHPEQRGTAGPAPGRDTDIYSPFPR